MPVAAPLASSVAQLPASPGAFDQTKVSRGVRLSWAPPRGAAPWPITSCGCLQPCYSWLEVPYYWAGLKAYDLVANVSNLSMSHYISASESMRRFPTLAATRSDGLSLKGTVRLFVCSFARIRCPVVSLLALSWNYGTALSDITKLTCAFLSIQTMEPPFPWQTAQMIGWQPLQ
jgi:hypothetical protein